MVSATTRRALLSDWAVRSMREDVGSDVPDAAELVRLWQVTQPGLAVDGDPGPRTMRALWLRHRPSAVDVVGRASAAVAWPRVSYRLGKGGFDWMRDAGAALALCDCSGFVAHCLGIPRGSADEAVGGPAWIETSQLVHDARGPQTLVRALRLAEAAPGDLVVHGDPPGGGQGHVGIVVTHAVLSPKGLPQFLTVDCGGPRRVSAIAEQDRSARWLSKGAIIARPVWYGQERIA